MTYRIFIILNLLFICKTTFVKAQEKFWQEVRGPYRGVVSTMILTSKATLLAGINEAGANKVYRSSDNGNTWNPVLSVNGTVLSFGIDSTQGRIYIGVDPPLNSDPSMYYSSDDGITWNVLQAPNTYILSIVVTSPGNIFLGTYNGIYKSINSGQNWNLIHNASDNNLIDALEFTPSGNLLIGTFLGGVYTSPDSGLSWTSIGLEGKRWTYPIKYSKTGSIYVGSNNGLLVSKDYGLTWNNIDSLSDGGVHSFDFDKNGNLYVGLAGWTYYTLNPSLGMCFSTDNGENWHRIGLKKYSISSVIIGTDGTIFVGSDGGIHRSIDKGNNWQSIGID